MKTTYFKPILSAALVVAATLGNVSCINDLDISSIDPQSSSSFDQAGAFVKQYAMLGLTGQKGLAGSPDLDGQDEGESGFYRTVFNCNELSTDECMHLGMARQCGHPSVHRTFLELVQPTYRMGICPLRI